MAEWNFAPLQTQGDELPDNDGGIWAGLNGFADADGLGVWSSDTWIEPSSDHGVDVAYAPRSRALNDEDDRPLTFTDNNQQVFSNSTFPDQRSAGPVTNHGETDQHHTTSQDLRSPPRQSNRGVPVPTSPSAETLDPATLLRSDNQDQHTHHQQIPQTYPQVLHSDTDDEDDMAPYNRRHSRNSNLVDLTQSPTMPTASGTQQSRTRKRSSTSTGGDTGSASKRAKRASISAVLLEDEDLQDEAPSADEELLKAQQQEALKMQEAKKDDGAVRIGQRTCIICLENYTNATISSCGELDSYLGTFTEEQLLTTPTSFQATSSAMNV